MRCQTLSDCLSEKIYEGIFSGIFGKNITNCQERNHDRKKNEINKDQQRYEAYLHITPNS